MDAKEWFGLLFSLAVLSLCFTWRALSPAAIMACCSVLGVAVACTAAVWIIRAVGDHRARHPRGTRKTQ